MKLLTRLSCASLVVAVVLVAAGCGTKQQANKPQTKVPTSKAKTSVAAEKPASGSKPAGAQEETKPAGEPIDLSQILGQQPSGAQSTAQGSGLAAGTSAKPVAVPASGRPTAKQLLAAVQATYRKVGSAKMTYAVSRITTQDGKVVQKVPGSPMTLSFKRPDKFSLKERSIQLYSDGKTFYTYSVPAKQYMKTKMSKEILGGMVMSNTGVGMLGLLLGVDYASATSSMSMLPDAKIGKRDTYVLSLKLKTPTGISATQKLWVGKGDLAVYKEETTTEARPASMKGAKPGAPKLIRAVETRSVSSFVPNPSLPDSTFTFHPPAGVKALKPPKSPVLKDKPAPDFPYKWTDGSTQKLSGLRGKPVVLYFWALPQCAENLSSVQEFYDLYKDRVHLVAVNLNDKPDKVGEYLKKKGLTFPTVYADEAIAKVVNKDYGLMTVPTVFVLDADGVIREGLGGNPTAEQIEQKVQKVSKAG